MEQMILKKRHLPDYTVGEEIFSAVSHGAGALLGLAGGAVLLVRAARVSGALGIFAAAVYSASLFILYTMSTLYHALVDRRAKYVFRIFDHCTIYLLIAGTYTPLMLVLIGGAAGWIVFAVLWALAALCITLNAIDLERFKVFSMICYIAMGWCVLLFIAPVIRALGPWGSALLVLGGISYTAGLLFYRRASLRYMHSVWHLFVLAGSVFQYFCILLFVY